jgi:hypothetical protein
MLWQSVPNNFAKIRGHVRLNTVRFILDTLSEFPGMLVANSTGVVCEALR